MSSFLETNKNASPLTPYLPQEDGLLPRWLLLIGTVSVIYSVQSFISLKGAREIYTAPTTLLTPLQSRTFGTYSMLSSVVRVYAAYNIHNKAVYELCIATWVLAVLHFMSEWLIYGTARMGRGLASPIILAGLTAIWMLAVKSDYVDATNGLLSPDPGFADNPIHIW